MSQEDKRALPTVVTAFQQVAEFHAKFGLPGLEQEAPRELNDEEALFRIAFMLEELREYIECSGFIVLHQVLEDIVQSLRDHIAGKADIDLADRTEDRDLHGELDALIDLSYVLHGTALFHGFSKFDQAFTHVHTKGNMVKVRATSVEQSKRGTKLDVVKPPGWTAPVLWEYLGCSVRLLEDVGDHLKGSVHRGAVVINHGGHTDEARQYRLLDGTHVLGSKAELLT